MNEYEASYMLVCCPSHHLYVNFVPNRVLGASPPNISPLESLLPRSVHTTLAQLRSGHYQLLNSYKACITSAISDVCPECGVAPLYLAICYNFNKHTWTLRRASVQLSKPSDATYSARPVGQPGCGRRLPQSGQLTIGEELLGYHNNNNNLCVNCHLFSLDVCSGWPESSPIYICLKQTTSWGWPINQVKLDHHGMAVTYGDFWSLCELIMSLLCAGGS